MRVVVLFLLMLFVVGCSDNSLYNFTGYVPNLDIEKSKNADTLRADDSYIYESENIGAVIKYYYPDGDTTQDSVVSVYRLYDKWGRLDSIYDKENNVYKKITYNTKSYITKISCHGSENFVRYYRYDSDFNLTSMKETVAFADYDSVVTYFTYQYSNVTEERQLKYSGGDVKVVYDNVFDEAGNILYSTHDNVTDTLDYEFKDNFFYKSIVKSGSKKLISKYQLNNNNEIVLYERYGELGEIVSRVKFSYSGDQITIDSVRFSGGEESRKYHVEKKTDGRILQYAQYNQGSLFIKKVYTYDGSNNLIKYEEFTKGDKLHKKFTREYNEYNLPIIEKSYNEDNEVIQIYKYDYRKFL